MIILEKSIAYNVNYYKRYIKKLFRERNFDVKYNKNSINILDNHKLCVTNSGRFPKHNTINSFFHTLIDHYVESMVDYNESMDENEILKEEISNLQRDITDLRDELSEIEHEKDDLSSQVNDLEANLIDKDTTIESLESEIENLKLRL